MNASTAYGQKGVAQSGTVLMVANYPPDVGFAWWLMENFWLQLAELARANGLAAMIAYPTNGVVPPAISGAGIATVIEPVPRLGLFGLWRTYRFLKLHRVRLVYFTDRAFASFTYVVFRFAGVQVLVNHDHTPGDRPPIGGAKGWLKSIWHRTPPATCDLQISVSKLIRDRSIVNARVPADRAVVVQNGIEPVCCDGNRSHARQELGLPLDAIVCMTVARASPYKRIDFVIEVARLCKKKLSRQDLYFVFCGDGPDMERLRRLAADAQVTDRFVFAGRRDDVRRLLCAVDIALHPSKGEAFSLAVIEYMSAGLTVLVPDIPTVCQAIRHDQTGIIYADGDATAVARIIEQLMDDPEKRLRLGRQASREVEKEYSLDRMNREFRSVLQPMVMRLQG